MYSRSRMFQTEERYQSNLPPVYNGNRFPSVHRETGDMPPAESPALPKEPQPTADPEDPSPPEVAEKEPAAFPSEHHPHEGPGTGTGLDREELVLIALLLLLSAEHDRAMDVIVILLLLLSVH